MFFLINRFVLPGKYQKSMKTSPVISHILSDIHSTVLAQLEPGEFLLKDA